MSVEKDIEIGKNMAALTGFRDRTPLLQPCKARAILDGHIGKALAKGYNPIMNWDDQRVPSFRASEDGEQIDPQNRARYELYLKRLGANGFNPDELAIRQVKGIRVKARVRAIKSKHLPKPSIKDHDQSGVQRQLKVVK